MVNTRSSQGGTRKRRRSSSPTPSETGSQLNKVRKTGRYYPTADGQLLEEERQSVEHSLEPPEHQSAIEYPDLNRPVPTKSRQSSRHSLPAYLNVPADIKFESLRVALARETQRRRRYTEGLVTQNAEVEVAEETTFIEPADLGIDPSQITTPKRPMILAKPSPLTVDRVPTPDEKREQKILNYENAIQLVIEEKAALTAELQNLQLAVRSLEFGREDMGELEICAMIRIAFDTLRSQEKEMDIDVNFEELSNESLVEWQADIVRGVLDKLSKVTKALEETEDRLVLTNAQYKGVLGKLAEREERNEAQQEQLEEADKLATEQAEDNAALRQTIHEHEEAIDQFQKESQRMEDEYVQEVYNTEQDRNERLDLMAEELDQEHGYRLVAEQEIADRDAAYTTLQINFVKTKDELDTANSNWEQLCEDADKMEDERDEFKKQLQEAKLAKDELDKRFNDLEDKAHDLDINVKKLTSRLAESDRKIEEQNAALEAGKLDTKAKETEMNQLRSDVFGVQEELKHKNHTIIKLEGEIEELNESMDKLQDEKDAVINDKNEQLDELENKLAEASNTIDEKDDDIHALRQENRSLITERDELRKALATRGKENRALKEINVNLLVDAEQDIATQRNWAARKATMVQEVRQKVEAVSVGAVNGTTTLSQQVEKTVIRKTVRDSGFHDDEGEEEEILEDELLTQVA